MFALGYGVFRFLVEFVRVPDANLGYLAFGWLTMGQLLCVPLIAVGVWLLVTAHAWDKPVNAGPRATGATLPGASGPARPAPHQGKKRR